MDMNIKEKIGQRIKQERTAKGLTRKALAELTESMQISRINNYERGDRTPGPEEIKELARALEVSPAFLMCLSDDRQGKLKKSPGLGALIPVLDYIQACDPAVCIEAMKNEGYSEKVDLIPVTAALSERIGEHAFALMVKDESMVPEFRVGDVLIVDPGTVAKPGEYVVALVEGNTEVIVRKYKQLTVSKNESEFELIALNSDWANLCAEKGIKVLIVGSLVSLNRSYGSKMF